MIIFMLFLQKSNNLRLEFTILIKIKFAKKYRLLKDKNVVVIFYLDKIEYFRLELLILYIRYRIKFFLLSIRCALIFLL